MLPIAACAALSTLLALLSSASPLGPHGVCAEGSSLNAGVCRELQAEGPTATVELLQVHAGRRAPPAVAGGGAIAGNLLGAARHAAGTTLLAEQASERQNPLSGIVDDFIHKQLDRALKSVKVDALVSTLNITLTQLDRLSREFQAAASHFREALLLNISAEGEDAAADLAVLVQAHMEPVQWSFGAVMDTLSAETPVLITVMGTLGLEMSALHLAADLDGILEEARKVEDRFGDALNAAAAMDGATGRDVDLQVSRIDLAVSAGLAAAQSLDESMAKALEGVLLDTESASRDAGRAEDAKVSFDAMAELVRSTTACLEQGLESILLGTREAASAAATALEHGERRRNGGGRGALPSPGLLLLAVFSLRCS